MLKIKKIMPAMKPSVLGHVIGTLPRSLVAFDDNMDTHRTTYPAISRVLYPGNTKVIQCTPEPSAYSNYDEAADGFVLCDVGGGISEVFVPRKLVVDALACSDLVVCQKLLDVMMATGALQVMVRTSVNSDNMDMGAGGSAFTGVMLHVDAGQMLSLDLVKELDDFPAAGADGDVFFARSGDSVCWSNKRHVFDGGMQLLFALDTEERKPPTVTRNATPQLERYLSWSCAERFRGLRVCLVPRGDGASILAAATAMLEKRESACKTVCTLQLRTQFAKTRATASKRKRVVMAAVSEESADGSDSD